jgi:hypothetical protein
MYVSAPHDDAMCSECFRWKTESVKVLKSRWRATPIKYKCTHGPHTKEFYKVEPDELSTLESSSPLNISGKRPDDDPPESSGSPKRRRTINYKERNSNGFKLVENVLLFENSGVDGVALDFNRPTATSNL